MTKSNRDDTRMKITVLGEAKFPSPIRRPVGDEARVPAQIIRQPGAPQDELSFELAGPREKMFFDPKQTRAGIVTCGGLCPGLNDVIRSLFLVLHHAYAVQGVLGVCWCYQRLDPARADAPDV